MLYKNLKKKNVYIQIDEMLQVDKNYYKLFSLKLLQILSLFLFKIKNLSKK